MLRMRSCAHLAIVKRPWRSRRAWCMSRANLSDLERDIAASAAILGEPLPLWKIAATALIMAGLAVNLLWTRRLPKACVTGEP